MLTHQDIWNAIDRLAKANGFSPSGLAKKAGLSSTLFNPSKRKTASRLRWPSTESLVAVLGVTGTSWDEFMAYADPLHPTLRHEIPILSTKDVVKPGCFDLATGALIDAPWDKMPMPLMQDKEIFALEITNKLYEPVYPEGTVIILSPKDKPRRSDRVCALTHRGELVIRLLGREGLQKIELMPLGHDATPVTLSKSDILWCHRIIWASQ